MEGVVYVRQTLGSSPRGRGKPVSLHLEEGTGGLIPAWAGKTCCCVCALFAHRAHPRVGGENSPPTPARRRFSGSSPRGRGKLVILPFLIVSHRLIPAWAGKTILSPGLNCAHRAHPRVGGENGQGEGLSAVARGSAPRGRGKLVVVVLGVVEFRLIPAWAGKTTSSTPSRRRSRAHPRVGGENLDLVHTDLYVPGSSPRGRGKQKTATRPRSTRRLIPAWAGKTTVHCDGAALARAHPRVGGENQLLVARALAGAGSSPRGRGKRASPT